MIVNMLHDEKAGVVISNVIFGNQPARERKEKSKRTAAVGLAPRVSG